MVRVKTCLGPHSPPQINQAPCKNLGDITLTRCRVHKKWTFLICRTAELLSGLAINQLRTNYCILACTAQSACNVMLRVREPSGLSIPSFTWNIGRSGFNSQAHVFWVSAGYHWVYSLFSLSLNGQILMLLMFEENLSNGKKMMFSVEVSVLDLHVFIVDDQVIWKNVGVDKELYWSLCFKLENFHCQRIIVELKIAETFKDLAYVVEGITKFEVHSVNLGKPQTCSIVGHFFRDFLLTFQMTKTGYWLSIA